MTRMEKIHWLTSAFAAEGIRSFTPDEFVPIRVKTPPAGILHRIVMIARVAQDIRDASAGRVWITSGYRDPVHNQLVGGVEHSPHVDGMAIDVVAEKWTPREVQQFLMDHRLARLMGTGFYDTFTHVDLRGLFEMSDAQHHSPAPARWPTHSFRPLIT
jgi:uncharacterized protein YcbK (DUF882 family)